MGARAAASLTRPLMLGYRGNVDPIIEGTLAIISKYATFIWAERVPMAKLQRAWTAASVQMGSQLSSVSTRGPIMATRLPLLRIGWTMSSAHILQHDIGHHISLLQFAPQDLRQLLRSSLEKSIDLISGTNPASSTSLVRQSKYPSLRYFACWGDA